jgi:hypothetical protein
MERLKSNGVRIWIGITFWLLLVLYPAASRAGYTEVSLGVSYNRSNYNSDSYHWNRRIGLSAGYHLTEVSEIELSFQDSIDRTKIIGYEDTTIHDQIYSLTWIQSLMGKDSGYQPFIKGGVGQLNRDATGVYAGGSSPPKRVDALTAVMGAGIKVFITRKFAVRAEFTSYLQGGSIRKVRDNISATGGISWFF